MTTTEPQSHDHLGRKRSANACDACRRRKVKCSRGLPRCANCQACRQACKYPSRTLKPGPKLGSVHKRRLLEHHDGMGRPSPVRPPASPKSASRERGSVDWSRQVDSAGLDEEALRSSTHMQAVSELCLPSNEMTATITDSTGSGLRPGHVLMRACSTLGLTPERMRQS